MKYIFLLISCLGSALAFAQSELPESFGDYRSIKGIEPGKVFTQTYTPPTFKKIVWRDSVLLLEHNQHLIENLEEGTDYNIVTKILITQPTYTIWEFEEPTIDTTVEIKLIAIDRICEEVEPMPKYEGQIIEDRIMVFNWRLKYLVKDPRGKNWKDFHRIGYHPKNSTFLTIACIEEMAEFDLFYKKVFQKDGKWWTETIADTIVGKRIIETIGNYNATKKIIPAKIDTFQMIAFYENSPYELNNSEFSIIYQNIIDKEEQFSNWTPVIKPRDCPITGSIKKIQEALIKKGYNTPTDNIFGKETKAALVQFQKDNNLPIGQLDRKTLKKLGLE